MEIKEFEKFQKKMIELRLAQIKTLRDDTDEKESSARIKKEQLEIDMVGLKLHVYEAFNHAVVKGSLLDSFLLKHLPMPHEKYPNCLEVIIDILANLIVDPLQYGKTTRGGVEQIGFVGSQTGAKVWGEVEADLKKICNDFFDITPFLDTEKENFPEIGFFMNSKWKSPNEPVPE